MAGMLYKHSAEDRERLLRTAERVARDFSAGSVFVATADSACALALAGDPDEHEDAQGGPLEPVHVQDMQRILGAAVAYVSRASAAMTSTSTSSQSSAANTALLVSLVSALLRRQYPSFPRVLLRFHAHVLSEIGHNDDPMVIEGLLGSLADVSMKMRALGMGALTVETAQDALRTHLTEMTQHLSTAGGEMGEEAGQQSAGILRDVLAYVEHRLSAYVTASLGDTEEVTGTEKGVSSNVSSSSSSSTKTTLTLPVYEVVQQQRIASLFDLVIDYPDSLPALEDLKVCIKRTRKYGVLIQEFSRSIMSRLLHPGASTSDIIQHYMSTIKVLKYIDPSGYILESISKPIQRYLRSRKDAIKNIVLLLTEDDDEDGGGMMTSLGSGLDDDVAGGAVRGGVHAAIGDERGAVSSSGSAALFGSTAGGASMTGLNQFYESDAAAFASIRTWAPAPLEIASVGWEASEGGGGRRPPSNTDTISLLTDIYGTKELFLSAYRSMLAEKLVHKIDFECTKELKTLELLKIRFGEAALQNAEIMMRDVNDSKRLNTVIHNTTTTTTTTTTTMTTTGTTTRRNTRAGSHADADAIPDLFPSLRVLVTSDQYWPSAKDDSIDFALPAPIEAATALFAERYHSQKAPRTLKWKKAVGEVSLDLTIGDETVEFTVSPVQATILLAFEDRPEYTVPDLVDALGLPEPVLMQNAIFWINEGVMRLDKNVAAMVLRRNDTITRPMTTMDVDDGGGDSDDGIDGSMDYLEPFIAGMLTNFDALPLDRIHNMLKMFVTDPPYDRSIADLTGLLERMVGRGVCAYDSGAKVYRREQT